MGKASRDKGLEWRQIPGFSAYEISECGVVRRLTAARTRRVHHIPKGGFRSGGYVQFKLVNDAGVKVAIDVHRLVALAFFGPRPTPAHEVAHWNDIKHENDRWNVRYVTLQENRDDAARNGLYKGMRNGRAKLTDAQVAAARSEYTGTYGEQSRIARKYGVTSQAMRDVLLGRHWRHV